MSKIFFGLQIKTFLLVWIQKTNTSFIW